jgi:hippurate hydrolase
MKRIAALAMTGLLAAAAPTPSTLAGDVERDYRANLAPLFLHFHRNPELSFRETQPSPGSRAPYATIKRRMIQKS